MPGPYRDDLEAIRARVRREEATNSRPGGWRRRLRDQPQLVVAFVFLAFGGLTAWLRGHDSATNFVFGRGPLDRHELDEPLEKARRAALETCGVPAGAHVDVDVSVIDGKPWRATVRTVPSDEQRGTCILDQVGKISWPSSSVGQATSVRWSRD